MFISYLSHGAPKIDQDSDKLIYAHDPAILGYFGVYFEGIRNLDSRIFDNTVNQYAIETNSDIRNPKLVEDSLMAYCTSVEIPELSLKIIDKQTVQYFSIKIPSTIDYGSQNVTFRFYDTSSGIVSRFIRNWFFALRRPDKHFPKKYVTRQKIQGKMMLKCNAILFATDPSLSEVTFACGFLGLMPTNLPIAQYASDVQTRTFAILSQTFSFDKIVVDDHIYNFAYNKLLPTLASHDGVVQWST